MPGGAFATTYRVVPPGTSATWEQSSHSGTGKVANAAASLADNVLAVPDGDESVDVGTALALRFPVVAARLRMVASEDGTMPAMDGGMVSVLTVTEGIGVLGAIVTVAVAVTVAADAVGVGIGFPALPTA